MDDHPYSWVREAGGAIHVSGAAAIDYSTGSPVSDPEEALDCALREVQRRLGLVDARLEDIVKVTYYLTDLKHRELANRQFIRSFVEPRPARTVIGVSSLPYGAIAVLDAIAVRNPTGRE
jgi:2-iminobutanoate/2-iminopropanoate deaminase